jgi:hypothetical protein
MSMGKLPLLMLLSLSVTTGACAYLDSTLTIPVPPVFSTAITQPTPVTASHVTDRRSDQRRIGCKKDSSGETADLFHDGPLAAWFASVWERELRRAGLSVVNAQDKNAVTLDVDIQDFFIEPAVTVGFMTSNTTVHAIVQAEITVRFPDGRAFARRFVGQSNGPSSMPTDGTYRDMMEGAMRSFLTQSIGETCRLLEQHLQSSHSVLDSWVALRNFS